MKTGSIHRDPFISTSQLTATADRKSLNHTGDRLMDRPMIGDNSKKLLEKEVRKTLQQSSSESKNDSVSGFPIEVNISDTAENATLFERNSTCQSKEGTKAPKGEDSVECMKERISSYLGYLESDTDSSDTELASNYSANQAGCQTGEIIQEIMRQSNNYTTEYETRKPCRTKKEECQSLQNEENLYVEKKFKLFTTKWDVKTREELSKPLRTPITPAFNRFSYKYDVSLGKQYPQLPSVGNKPQLYEVNSQPKINEQNQIAIKDTDNTENVKTTTTRLRNVPFLSNCTLVLESIQEDRSDKEKTNSDSLLAHETLEAKRNSFEGSSDNNLKHGQWKDSSNSVKTQLRQRPHSRPCNGNCEDECCEKTVVEEEQYKGSSGQSCMSTGGNETNLENKATQARGDAEKNCSEVTCVQTFSKNSIKSLGSERAEDHCRTQSVKPANRESLDSGNCFKSTKHQPTEQHANDARISSEKNSTQIPPEISKNINRKRCLNAREHVIREKKSVEVKLVQNCQSPEDEKQRKEAKTHKPEEGRDKRKRSRSRSNSLGRKECRRSRSGSIDRRRKSSPIRDRRKFQTRRRMQFERADRRPNRHFNESSFSSWINNIVVKIADPPRPPRKRQQNSPKGRVLDTRYRETRNRSIERQRWKPSPYDERTAAGEEDSERMNKKRRWTYNGYVRRTDGSLSRKPSFDRDKEPNSYWGRYDDENSMPYKGYADSQVQSLLKQLCGHYVTKLYSSQYNDVRRQSSYVAVSNQGKPHRTWYMTSSRDWISHGEDTMSSETKGSTQDTARESHPHLSNPDQQTRDQITAAVQEKQATANDYRTFFNKESHVEKAGDEDVQFTATTLEKIQNNASKHEETMVVQLVPPSKDNNFPTAMKGDHEGDEDDNHGKENREDTLDENNLNLPMRKFQPFSLKRKTLCEKTFTNEVFNQSDCSDDEEEKRNNEDTHKDTAIDSDMEISETSMSNYCESTSSQDHDTEIAISTNREDDDKTSSPGSDKSAFQTFASDSFAVSNLCKSGVTSLGKEVTSNELLVMVTPSSYIYEKKTPREEESLESVSCKQSLCVPTSTSLSRPTNVVCTSVCFHFDIGYFETPSSVDHDTSIVDDFSSKKPSDQILNEKDPSVKTLPRDFSRCNNTRNSNDERHLVFSEPKSPGQTLLASETKNDLDSEKSLPHTSEEFSNNTETNSRLSPGNKVHRTQTCGDSSTVTSKEDVTSGKVSDTLELRKFQVTTTASISTKNKQPPQPSRGISSKSVPSHSQESYFTSNSTSSTFQNHDNLLPSCQQADMERLMIQSRAADSNTGEDMWELALMTNPSTTSTSSTQIRTHSKGCDLDIAIVKPSRRTTTTSKGDSDSIHAEKVQNNIDMQEKNNNYITSSNGIQNGNVLKAKPHNYENSAAYPISNAVKHHQQNTQTAGCARNVDAASNDLLFTGFNEQNIQNTQQKIPVMTECGGQRSISAEVSTYPPQHYPVVPCGSRISSQPQLQPEFIKLAPPVDYVDSHSVVNNNRFNTAFQSTASVAIDNQDGTLNQHPAFGYNKLHPYAYHADQRLFPQNSELSNQHCNTSTIKGCLPVQRTSSRPYVAMETTIGDSYNVALTDSYNVGVPRQAVHARKQNVVNMSVVPVDGRYCEPQSMAAANRAYDQPKICSSKQDQHQPQMHSQLQQQQQHYKPSIRAEQVSDDWHATFLDSVHRNPSDLSHIPWGQHVLDRSHQTSHIPGVAQNLIYYQWY